WFLNYLQETFGDDPDKLKNGFKIQLGWSILSLQERNSELVVCEPDYRKNPFEDWHDDITCTLKVQAEQNEILELTEAEGNFALFQDTIIYAKGCLAEQRVYLHRSPPAFGGDSGWYIGPVKGSAKKPVLEKMHVYELLRHRPALLQVLCLPVEYMVIFN